MRQLRAINLTSDVTLRFAAGKVLSRKRAGLTEKRLTKICTMEMQHQDRRLGPGDSI